MQRWKKGLVAMIAIVIASTAVIATQYATVKINATVIVNHQFSAIQYMASDGSPVGSGKVLTWDGANFAYKLDFGTWMPGSTKLFTATFALVNTESVPLMVTGIRVTGDVMLGEIWLHENMSKLSNTNISGVTPGENPGTNWHACQDGATADSTVEYFDGTNPVATIPWVLAAGHGYSTGGTILDYTNDGGTGWTSASYTSNVWVYDAGLTDATGLTCSSTTSLANFVWVEMQLVIPSDADSQTLNAVITFSFASI